MIQGASQQAWLKAHNVLLLLGTSCSSAVGLYSFDGRVMADKALWQCTGQAFAVVDHAMRHGTALAVPVVAHNAVCNPRKCEPQSARRQFRHVCA